MPLDVRFDSHFQVQTQFVVEVVFRAPPPEGCGEPQ
jgi:hypothetical protein